MACDPISLTYLVTEKVESLFLSYIFFVLNRKEIKVNVLRHFFSKYT